MTGSALATSRLSRWLSTLGGVLCVVGYFLPWVTYHPDIEGHIWDVRWSGWSTAWSEWHSTPPDIADRVVGATVLAIATLPLLMGILALVVGAREWLGLTFRVPRALFWTAIILATLALLLMTYTIDPFGWSAGTEWVMFHEPAPSIEIGLYMMYAGMLAIIAGGLLLRDQRRVALAAEHA